MTTVPVRYVGPYAAVEIDLIGEPIGHGDVIEVPEEVAYGRPGVPRIGEDGEPLVDDDSEPVLTAGYGGLLDQPDNWELAKPAKPGKPKPDDDKSEPAGASNGGDA